MKPVTIELCQADYCLIREKSDSSKFFFSRCIIDQEDYEYPFGAVTIKFVPDRLTRRPMIAMLKELISCILEDDVNKEHLCELVFLFIFYLG